MTVLIGMPSASAQIPSIMVSALLQLRKPVSCGYICVDRQRVDKARNEIVKEALKQNFDYLLFVDDDNPIPPDTLELMLADDKDIVSAPILSRNLNSNNERDLCSFYSREVVADGEKINLYDHIKEFRDDGPLHRIDATGTGCVLIKRKVLEVLYKKYEGLVFEFGDVKFNKPITVDGVEYKRRTMSEDAEFSERAINSGFEIWLDDRIRPIHLTTMGAVQWHNGT